MIVFGGNPTAGSCASGLNDLWVLSNANGLGGVPTWSALATTGGPSPRRSQNANYDAANNIMMLFGGDLSCASPSNEAWVLSHANGLGGASLWSLLSANGTLPSPWSLHSGVYYAGLNRLTTFGGLVSGIPSNSLLDLSNADGIGGSSAWRSQAPTNYQPSGRSLHSAVQDEINHRMIVFGGLAAAGRQSDVWVLEQTQGRVLDVPPVIAP